ncbi:MAG TPA: carboxypeptidase regulatory-like domain-containing protein [Longimicrobiales bacterium]|nr:carboxypeptidase regulatory-like domain-containing protein [Longimicrobiales bacterium]
MSARPRTLSPAPFPGGAGHRCVRRRAVRSALVPVAALLGLCLAPSAARAQTASLDGRVTSPDGRPITEARIVIIGTAVAAVSGTDGAFELRYIPVGVHIIEIERIGYRKLQTRFAFGADAAVHHDFVLQMDPVRGDTLQARGRAALAMPAHMRGFYDRRDRGYGHFFTRDEITRMQARQFTDVLRRIPGVQVRPVAGPFGTAYAVQMGRAAGVSGSRDCSVLYYVNGAPFIVALDIGINTYIRPEDVSAVEVYSGSASIPPQFTSTSNNSRCGVVVIWTYAGRDWPDAPR